MKLATGNDLVTGDVVWWDGAGWSRHFRDAADVRDGGPALIAREEAALRVNVAYLLDAEPSVDGPIPAHIKDRIRAAGPTTHPALAIHPELTVEGDGTMRATRHLPREAKTSR